MKKKLLINAGIALYGERWQSDLARDLELSDSRRIRQWLSGDRPIPKGIADDLVKLLEERKVLIEQCIQEIVTSGNES